MEMLHLEGHMLKGWEWFPDTCYVITSDSSVTHICLPILIRLLNLRFGVIEDVDFLDHLVCNEIKISAWLKYACRVSEEGTVW
jgi:hypothetical protein